MSLQLRRQTRPQMAIGEKQTQGYAIEKQTCERTNPSGPVRQEDAVRQLNIFGNLLIDMFVTPERHWTQDLCIGKGIRRRSGFVTCDPAYRQGTKPEREFELAFGQ